MRPVGRPKVFHDILEMSFQCLFFRLACTTQSVIDLCIIWEIISCNWRRCFVLA